VDAVVDGVSGALVPARDAGALRAAIGAYLRDPALRARHGAAGRDRVLREFEQARLWQALHDEYVALAAAAERPRRRGAAPAAGVP
jgi:glycosyltransferase involved in cell wall biosynthesis